MSISLQTSFCRNFQLNKPIILAGMAGNINSAELVAAVCEAGGLGTIAAAYVTPEALRERIRKVRELTDRPFAVNLLLFDKPADGVISPECMNWINQVRERFGLPRWNGEWPVLEEEIEACFQVIIEEKPAVFSCAMGLPGSYGKRAKEAGMKVIGMATTLEEARLLVEEGVDAIVAQGGEAGGHRGTFAPGETGPGECIGTLPLVSLLCSSIQEVPIIAAGGIMNGQGIVAALALGADAVQVGTRFLGCAESTAHMAYKSRLYEAKETDTAITRSFSGRPARGIRNTFMEQFQESGLDVLPYPIQNEITKEIRQAAGKVNDSHFMSLWAGQGVALLKREESASDIIEQLMNEASQGMERLTGLCTVASRNTDQ
ncbi:NAD(P)H-dependent flavin oxidoreductase [Brevibacillus daliensis]|uniref:NAD(P)H-dependent flavin oxidoreductase n=1 Tax=Brevibacillus daliensis TaxID=2892995 RepID=UPI001E3CA432|nr:nitronate monooxygenase [Brevibacillus daliensis]